MCVYVYRCVRACTYMYMCMYMCMRVYMHMDMYTHLFLFIHVYLALGFGSSELEKGSVAKGRIFKSKSQRSSDDGWSSDWGLGLCCTSNHTGSS